LVDHGPEQERNIFSAGDSDAFRQKSSSVFALEKIRKRGSEIVTENSGDDRRGDEAAQRLIDDIYGRMAAIDYVVKRLLASHAEMFPEGIGQRLLDEEEKVLASLAEAQISDSQLQAMRDHLRMMFRDARRLPQEQ
jgi:hypothetical protein